MAGVCTGERRRTLASPTRSSAAATNARRGLLASPVQEPSSRAGLGLTRRRTRSRGCRLCPKVVAGGARIKNDGVRAVVARWSGLPGRPSRAGRVADDRRPRWLCLSVRRRGTLAGAYKGERRRALATPTRARAVARVSSMPRDARRGAAALCPVSPQRDLGPAPGRAARGRALAMPTSHDAAARWLGPPGDSACVPAPP